MAGGAAGPRPGHRLADRGAAQVMPDGRQALAVRKPPLPAVHLAGEDTVADRPEPGEVSLEVGAAALQLPVAERDRLRRLRGVLLGEPTLRVVEPLLRQTLEEDVDELVVRADPLRGEAAGQEQ